MQMPAAGAAHALGRRLVFDSFVLPSTLVAPLAEGHSWPFLKLGPPFMAGQARATGIFASSPVHEASHLWL